MVTWTKRGNLRGPTGATGPVGPAGADGAPADPTALNAKLDKSTSLAPQGGTAGFWAKLNMTSYSTNGTDVEPLMVQGYRNVAQRAFWLNENGSPRGASINNEPALKLFGPNADAAYAGLLFQVLKRYGDQQHIFGVHTDGRLRVGTGQTAVGSLIQLAVGAAVPTGLPAGYFIIRTQAGTLTKLTVWDGTTETTLLTESNSNQVWVASLAAIPPGTPANTLIVTP